MSTDLTFANRLKRELPPQPDEQPQLRHRNTYDYDGEYEFPICKHWTTLGDEADPMNG